MMTASALFSSSCLTASIYPGSPTATWRPDLSCGMNLLRTVTALAVCLLRPPLHGVPLFCGVSVRAGCPCPVTAPMVPGVALVGECSDDRVRWGRGPSHSAGCAKPALPKAGEEAAVVRCHDPAGTSDVTTLRRMRGQSDPLCFRQAAVPALSGFPLLRSAHVILFVAGRELTTRARRREK